MTDPRGNSAKYDGDFTIVYHYDDLNRLVKGELPKSIGDDERPVVELRYDARGNLKERIDVDGSVSSYEYYPRNWVRKETISGADKSYTIEYIYDLVGNNTEIKDSDGNITRKEYDDLGRVMSIIYPEGNYEEFIVKQQII